eukprot:6456531-Amphidinium_carterae.1
MCNAFQPAVHAKLLWEQGARLNLDFAAHHLSLECGGEDLPDAYRQVPCDPRHLRYNIVAVKNPNTGETKFQIVYAMLFGLASA